MGRNIETNAQNSERDPNERPSSARIEKIIEDTDPDKIATAYRSGLGENLRPSERESPVIGQEDMNSEKEKEHRKQTHRTTPDEREW